MTKANPLKNKYDINSEVSRIDFLRSYLIEDLEWNPERVYDLTLSEMEMAYRLFNGMSFKTDVTTITA